MGKPKKRTSPRRTGNRRSHHFWKLAKRVNATSPVKVVVKPKTAQKEAEVVPAKK